MPSDSTTCRPSNNPSPLSRPLSSLTFPCPWHTQQPPQPLARSFARLLASLPSLGYNFAQICPLAVLHTPSSLPSREALSAVSLAHLALLFPRSMPPALSSSHLHTLPSTSTVTAHFRKSLSPCCRHTWDTLSLTHSQALCTHSFCGIPFSSFNPCTLAIHALLRTRVTAFSLSTFPSYS